MGKRKQYRGVRPVSDTTIEIDFSYGGRRCRERLKLSPTDANLRKASNRRSAIIDAIDRGIFDYAATFPNSTHAKKKQRTEVIKYYLANWMRGLDLKASTRAGYSKIVNNQLTPAFGDYELGELRWVHIKEWAKSKDVTTKTLNNILSVLRTSLDDAVEDELIQSNPMSGRKLKRRTPVKIDKIDPFSIEERKSIVDSCVEGGQEQNVIMFGFWTGLRISEICALDWGDVDLKAKVVHVTKALTDAAKVSELPKTDAGRRKVVLLPPAIKALQAQKSHTFLIATEEVFQSPRTLSRWTGDKQFRESMWRPRLKKCGVRYRYPYQMRHTYCSTLLMTGELPMWVSSQMGHTNWGFTARTYSRFIPNDAPDAGSKAVSMWENADGNADVLRGTEGVSGGKAD
jgi:integrase